MKLTITEETANTQKKGDTMRRKSKTLQQSSRRQNIEESALLAKCPYFQESTLFAITCESLVPKSRIVLKFKEKERKQGFFSRYCCDLHKMQLCPQYKLLHLYHETRAVKREIAHAEALLAKLKMGEAKEEPYTK